MRPEGHILENTQYIEITTLFYMGGKFTQPHFIFHITFFLDFFGKNPSKYVNEISLAMFWPKIIILKV